MTSPLELVSNRQTCEIAPADSSLKLHCDSSQIKHWHFLFSCAVLCVINRVLEDRIMCFVQLFANLTDTRMRPSAVVG